MDASIHMTAFKCDQRKPPPPLQASVFKITAVISCSGSNRVNKCVISLPAVVLRVSLHTVVLLGVMEDESAAVAVRLV